MESISKITPDIPIKAISANNNLDYHIWCILKYSLCQIYRNLIKSATNILSAWNQTLPFFCIPKFIDILSRKRMNWFYILMKLCFLHFLQILNIRVYEIELTRIFDLWIPLNINIDRALKAIYAAKQNNQRKCETYRSSFDQKFGSAHILNFALYHDEYLQKYIR